MMSTILFAFMLFLCSVKMNTEATLWSTGYEQRLTNSAQWNSIQPNERAIVYIPVPKYPVKSQEPIPQKYTNNYIPKPNQIADYRPPSPSVIHRPSAQSQLQYSPYMHVNTPSKIPVSLPDRQSSQLAAHRPMNPQFGSQNVDEYLLHGQMPLTVGQTYVMPNTAQTPEPDYLT